MYIKNGDSFWPTSEANLDIHKTLGNGVYEVGFDKDRGFFFKVSPAFDIPPKLYGDISDTADRILHTYSQRDRTTGVMLDGLKGSGKTMLAKVVSARAAASQGIPTILIGTAFTGSGFNQLIRNIPKAVIIFDEFEKMYDMDDGDQNELLSLFDGVFTSKSLILVTCNNSYAVSDFFKNRPGRIYYTLKFGGLDQKFVKDYCDDKLVNQSNSDQVLEITGLAGNYSFDMVQALVEEMNRYGETPAASLKYLNFEAFNIEHIYFDVKLTFNGTSYVCHTFRGLPVTSKDLLVNIRGVLPSALKDIFTNKSKSTSASYIAKRVSAASLSIDDFGEEEEMDSRNKTELTPPLILDQTMLISKDNANKTYTYRHPSGAVVVYTHHVESSFNYLDVL